VDDVSFVERVQPTECLVKNIGTDTFSNIALALFNYRRETTRIHELEEDPQTLSIIEGLKALNDIVIFLAHLHDSELILDDLSLLRILRLNEFESALFTIFLALNKEDSGKASIADLLYDFIELRWVLLAELSCLTKFRGEFAL
jgi:hypothetical protein